MAGLRSLQCAAVLLAVTLLLSSSSAATATTERYNYPRKLLVAPVRTSPETAWTRGQQQGMDVSGWRTAAPFRRPGASLGRRLPGSFANPSHN
uniref:Uncharacterized protein n=1 Tax=Oryza brachyantha TaxID=4533 RepID=J3LCK7_ORYBR